MGQITICQDIWVQNGHFGHTPAPGVQNGHWLGREGQNGHTYPGRDKTDIFKVLAVQTRTNRAGQDKSDIAGTAWSCMVVHENSFGEVAVLA